MKKLLIALVFIIGIIIFSTGINAQSELVAYWKFDEGFGDTAYDSSGNGNDGFLTCTGFGCSLPEWKSGSDCKFGSCLKFNGLDNFVFVSDSDSLDVTDGITIEAWIKLDNITGGQILSKRRGDQRSGYGLTATKSLEFTFGNGTKQIFSSSNIDSKIGKWSHVAVTYDKNNITFYFDGQAKKVVAQTEPVIANIQYMYIGAMPESEPKNFFNGSMDELAIYNRALTAEEIEARYMRKVELSRQLRDRNGIILKADIILYQSGTNIVNVSTQTDANGNYVLSFLPNIYDLQYNISNFFIPNFWIKLLSLNLNSNKEIVNYVTGYPSKNKLSFTADVENGQIIQTYSEIKPARVMVNNTVLQEVSSIFDLTVGKWFYDATEKKLYIKVKLLSCSDDTLYGQCSLDKPKYCENGILVDRCSLCNCPGEYNCQTDGSCGKIFKIDFEHFSHFQYGNGAKIWDTPTGMGSDFPNNIFEPSKAIARSPSTSGKLELKNPINDGSRRIHLGHGWNPLTDRHLWLEAWIYLPPDFKVNDWTILFKAVEERYANRSAPWDRSTPGYGTFQIGFGLNEKSKVTETEYKFRTIINHGWVDENYDGINDLGEDYTIFTPGTVKFGEWFKVKVYLYRDTKNGILKFWINDALQLNLTNIRTIGNSPEKMANPPEGWEVFFDTQIALYSGDLPNVNVKSVYFDDVILKSGEGDILEPPVVGKTITVDFEDAADFIIDKTFNIQTKTGPAVWQIYTGPSAGPTDVKLFEQSTTHVHSGKYSARLALLNPAQHGTENHRLHIEHVWDPWERHVMIEAWVYIPSGFYVDEWTVVGPRLIEERLWPDTTPNNDPNRPDPNPNEVYNWWQIGFGFNNYSKSTLPSGRGQAGPDEYYIHTHRSHGYVDNDFDGSRDLAEDGYWIGGDTLNNGGYQTVKFGKWFHVRHYVYRDFTHGRVMMWLNGKLILDDQHVRTIGIDPDRIIKAWKDDAIEEINGPFSGRIQGWFSSGIVLYTGQAGAHPKEIWIDDVVISTTFRP